MLLFAASVMSVSITLAANIDVAMLLNTFPVPAALNVLLVSVCVLLSVRTAVPISIVGLAETPLPFATTILAVAAVIVRCAQVSVVVRTAKPVLAKASSAAKSLARTKVDLRLYRQDS